MHEDFKLLQKAYDMTLYGYQCLRHFPKSERHVLAQEIRLRMIAVLRLIIEANRQRQKLPVLRQLDTELDVLRIYLRLARDLGFLDFKKYENWARAVSEVGRMVGGWVKSQQRP